LDAVDGFEPGQQLRADEVFKVGDMVDVAGTSIGKGFQGAPALQDSALQAAVERCDGGSATSRG